MTLTFCKTEKELKAVVINCYKLKMRQHYKKGDPALLSAYNKSAIARMLKDDSILEIGNVRYAITHIFRMLHRSVYALAAYPDVLRLSMEFDYLQSEGTWHYVKHPSTDARKDIANDDDR